MATDEKDTPVGPDPDGPGRRVGPPGQEGNEPNGAADPQEEDSMATEGLAELTALVESLAASVQDVKQEAQAARQGAQQSAQEAQQASQAARQASEQVEQAVQAAQQASRGVGAETSGATVETQISPQATDAAWRANLKGMFDRFQTHDVEGFGLRRSQDLEAHGSRRSSDGHLRRLELLAEYGLAKALGHSDFATDRLWAGTDAVQSRGDQRTMSGRPRDVVDAEEA